MLIKDIRKEIKKQMGPIIKEVLKEMLPIVKEIAIASAKEYVESRINKK